jgi:alkylhydroperoxidase family enzyme
MTARMPRPTAARIPPILEPDDRQRELLQNDVADQPLNIFRTLAHNTKVLKRFNQLGGVLLFRGTVPEREREIVILRVGWNCQSVYEFGQHTTIGLRCGLSAAEITALCRPVADHPWATGDADLIALADDLCRDDCVSDETWARLARTWTEEQLVELVVCAGFYRMVSGFLNSAGVQLDPGVPSWPAGVFD